MQQYEIEKYIKNSIITLSNRCTSSKVEILRPLFFNQNASLLQVKIKEFREFLHEFVDDNSSIANTIASDMRSVGNINDIGNIQVIDHDFVKQFVYVNYDYPSVLQYADGLIKGLVSGNIRSEEDIDNLRNDKMFQAFNTHDHNIPSLLDAVVSERIGSLQYTQSTQLSLSLFNNMKNNNTLFPISDRNNIIGCIDKILEYISTETFINSLWNDTVDKRLAILSYGSVIDYLAYIITLYTCRINVIHRFVNPYIVHWKSMSNMNESTDDRLVISNTISNIEIGNMIRVDNFDKTFDSLAEYLCSAGCSKDIKLFKVDSNTTNKLNDNLIWSELQKAPTNDRGLDILSNVIRSDYSYPMSDDSSSKELLDLIPVIDADKSVGSYKKIAEDAYKIGKTIANGLINIIDTYSEEFDKETVNGNINGVMSFLEEMYKLVMQRIHSTFLIVEKEFNDSNKNITSSNFDKTTSVDVNISSTDTVKPDTLNEAYIDLSYDTAMNYQLYNEYLTTLPGFEDSLYLSEAGAGDLIKKIVALMQSLGKLIAKTFNDARLKHAVNWVTKNENNLLNLKYPDNVDITFLPYKSSIKFPEGIDKTKTALSGFNMDNVKDINTWAASLYPDAEIAKWFSNPESKPADIYKNYLLFYNSIGESKAESPAPIEKVTGNDLQNKYMKQWISTVKGAVSAGQTLTNLNNTILNSIKNIENKLVQEENKQKAANNSSTDNSQTPSQPAPSIDTNVIIQAINTVINNIWNPILRYFYMAIQDQYKYIQNAYNILKTNQAADNATNDGANNPLITGSNIS